jgi:predicted permease
LAAGAAAGLCTLLLAGGAAATQIAAVLRTANLAHAARRSRGFRAQTPLLLVQTTLAMILLAGAGLFGRSLYNLASQDFGMRMNDVLLVRFAGGPGFVPGQDQVFGAAIDRVRALPGVAQATPVKILPFTGFNVPPISVPGLVDPPNIGGQLPFLIAATSELFDVLGLQIVEGRRFAAADMPGAPVAIVNETMARTVWPGRSALGRCFRIGFDPAFDPSMAAGPPSPPLSAPCLEIVGVVRDVRQRSVVPANNEARLMQYYVPFGLKVMQGGGGTMPQIHGLLVRANADPDALAGPIRRLVIGHRTDLPFLDVRPYAELLDSQMRPWRTGTALLTVFSALALVVSAIGLYAAFAHSVAERRHEMAVRIAIGARPAGVLLMILREAGRLAVAGIVCGWIAAALAGRWTESMLFGTTPADPLVAGAGAVLLLAVAASATFLPARTAARSDPSALLRAE